MSLLAYYEAITLELLDGRIAEGKVWVKGTWNFHAFSELVTVLTFPNVHWPQTLQTLSFFYSFLFLWMLHYIDTIIKS